MRECVQCKENRDDADFYKGKKKCKACLLAYSNAWRAANPEKAAAIRKRSDLKRRKEVDYKGGLRTSKKELERVKAYYEANREARLAYHKQWRTENREKMLASIMARRARKKGAEGRFTAAEWIALNEAYGWRCVRCGVHNDESKLTKDHVISLMDGGSNRIENIQPLCLPCNLWKNSRSIDFRGLHPEQKAAAEAALAPLKGKNFKSPSLEVRKRISEKLTGYKHGEESRRNTAIGVKDSWTRRGARSDSKSGVRGVIWDSEYKKWRAGVTVNGERKKLGRFETIEEAAEAIRKFLAIQTNTEEECDSI